jgi:hypothetical protein
MHRPTGHHCGDGVLINHLRDGIPEEDNILVKGLDMPLKLDSVNQIDRNWDMLLA